MSNIGTNGLVWVESGYSSFRVSDLRFRKFGLGSISFSFGGGGGGALGIMVL